MTASGQMHLCDDRCICPVHDTPMWYSRSCDDHACQDPDCVFAHGFNEAWWAQMSDHLIMKGTSNAKADRQTPAAALDSWVQGL
jgi:hypothetical protein